VKASEGSHRTDRAIWLPPAAGFDKMPRMARRFQFRLRTLLVGVALAAVGCVLAQLAVSEFRERAKQERIRLQRAATNRIWDLPGARARFAEEDK
jgi:hypothetical protein